MKINTEAQHHRTTLNDRDSAGPQQPTAYIQYSMISNGMRTQYKIIQYKVIVSKRNLYDII